MVKRNVKVTLEFIKIGDNLIKQALNSLDNSSIKLSKGMELLSSKLQGMASKAGIPINKLQSTFKRFNLTVDMSGKFFDTVSGKGISLNKAISRIETPIVKSTRELGNLKNVSKHLGVEVGQLDEQLKVAGVAFNRLTGFTDKNTNSTLKNKDVVTQVTKAIATAKDKSLSEAHKVALKENRLFDDKKKQKTKEYDTDHRHAIEYDKLLGKRYDADHRHAISRNKIVDNKKRVETEAEKATHTLAIKENAMREMVNRKSAKGNALSKVSLENMTGAMRSSNLTLSDTGKWMNNVTGEEVKLRDAQLKLNKTTDTFNMNYLGIMFAGMAVQKAFDGMQQSAMQAQGVTEDWSYVMADYFSPNAEYMSRRIENIEWAMDKLGPAGQSVVNSFVMLGSAAGRVGFNVGQMMLGYHSIRQELPDIIRFVAKKTGLAKKEATVITKETIPAINSEINTTKKSQQAAVAHTNQVKKKTAAVNKNAKANRKASLSMKGVGLAAVGTVGAMALMSSEASATSDVMEDVGGVFDWLANDVYGGVKEFFGGSAVLALAFGVAFVGAIRYMVLPNLYKYITGTLLASKGTVVMAASAATASGSMVGLAGSTAVATTGVWGLATAIYTALAPIIIFIGLLYVAFNVGKLIGTMFMKNKDSIAKMFSGLGKSISNVFRGIVSGAKNSSIDIATWFGNAGTWVIDSFGNVWDFVVGIWESFTGYIGDKLEYIKEKGSEVITKVITYFSDLKNRVFEKLADIKQYFSDKISDMKTKFIEFKDAFILKFNEIKTKVLTVFAIIKSIIDEKINDAKLKFEEIKTKVYSVFDGIKTKVESKINEMKAKFEEIKAKVYGVFESIRTKVETKIEEVRAKIDEKIEFIKTKIEEIKTKFKDTFDTIKDNISWSKLVEVGESIMSKIAEGIGKAKALVTEAIYNIPVVGTVVQKLVESGLFGEVPKFANGGIVTGPTLAMIGERGPEAVVPLNGTSVGGNVTYSPTITIHADISNDVDIDYLTRRINENLYNETRRQGIR